jgi:hypothetical protein
MTAAEPGCRGMLNSKRGTAETACLPLVHVDVAAVIVTLAAVTQPPPHQFFSLLPEIVTGTTQSNSHTHVRSTLLEISALSYI